MQNQVAAHTESFKFLHEQDASKNETDEEKLFSC